MLPPLRLRRPSPAMAVALTGVFLALNGPATASHLIQGATIRPGTVRSAQIRDHSLEVRDLSKRAITALQVTPAGSVGSDELAPGGVGLGKLAVGAVDSGAIADKAIQGADLADGAVGSAQLAPGSVGTAAIADGSLQTTDVGDYYGTVTVDFKPFQLNDCQVAKVDNPQATRTPAQIGDDIILVSPAAAGFSDLITISGTPGAGNSLRLIACRVGKDPSDPDNPANVVDPPPTTFQYLGIDGP